MEKELKTAAAYIRVSTDRQTELSPDSQLRIIKEYANKTGTISRQSTYFEKTDCQANMSKNGRNLSR